MASDPYRQQAQKGTSGCLIIGVLNNGHFLLNVPAMLQYVIKGYVILIAVAIDQASPSRSRDSCS